MGIKNKTVINQFIINNIANVPCDSVFLNLLPQICTIKRPYDSSEGINNTNDYGEVIMTYAEEQVVGTDIPVRTENISQRGKTGLGIELQGGEVRATYRFFLCPSVDIIENDVVIVGSINYQVLLVSRFYDAETLHHLEALLREITHL